MSEHKSRWAERHPKGPHRYSELYMQWRAAVRAGDWDKARIIGDKHTQRYMGIERWRQELDKAA